MTIRNHFILTLATASLVSPLNAVAHKASSENNVPPTTYSPSDSLDNDNVTEGGELLQAIIPDREIDRRHEASEFGTVPLERHLLPPYYFLPAMDNINDFVTTQNEMVTINPAPGEFVRIMEGKRHGFESTTVGMTITQQGGGAPLHTHDTEETHVLVDGGKVRYQLGNDIFVVKAPYVINIPPMVPHAFMNLRKKPIEMVVVFPHNSWEADFVEHPEAQEFFTLPITKEDRQQYPLIKDQ